MRDALARTRRELAAAGHAGRALLRPRHAAVAAAFVALLLLPWWAPGFVEIDSLANWTYLALAAAGLWLSVGLAGMPALSQGAFMSIGAFTTALLTARAGWAAEVTTPIAIAVALAAGLAVGAPVIRLQRLYLAVATWVFTWLVALVATEFPGVSGGAQGYVVTSSLGSADHYVIGLSATAVVVVLAAVLQRSSVGLRLRAVRDEQAAAVRLGVPANRLLLGTFAASAAVAGLAGSLAVQLAGVSDPSAFGPVTSFKLFVAVLLGGAAFAAAGPVGITVLGAIALLVRAYAALGGNAGAQLEPLVAAVLLLCVLGTGADGLLPALARLRRREPHRPAPSQAAVASRPRIRPLAAELTARGLSKHFGGLDALDSFDLRLEPGRCVGLVGANGSGKTTALRALSGLMTVDSGEILVDGRPPPRPAPLGWADLGIVSTLQRTSVFESLTTLESAVVGSSLRRRFGGPFRAMASTPKSRAEGREARGRALDALRIVGLDAFADEPAVELDSHRRRLLMLASALAAEPRALLLDEPSAGATAGEAAQLVDVLRRIGGLGVTLLVVEHNLRLVSAVADRMVVMDAGRIVAEGAPPEIAPALVP